MHECKRVLRHKDDMINGLSVIVYMKKSVLLTNYKKLEVGRLLRA